MKNYTDKQSQLAMINGDNHSERSNPCPVQPTLTTAPFTYRAIFGSWSIILQHRVSVSMGRRHLFLDVLNSLEHLRHTNQQIISEKEKSDSPRSSRWGGGARGQPNSTQSEVRVISIVWPDDRLGWAVTSYYYGIYEHFSAAFYL